MIQTAIAASAAPPIDDDAMAKTVTSRKIGKITYVIEASSNETATDTLKRKIEGMILRECSRWM
jgi:hypothetical protein